MQLLNEGLGLVIHAGHGTDDAWEQCFSVHSLERVNNVDRLPVMISAGCSTAICAALGPYQAYIDVDGREHAGTDNGQRRGVPGTTAPAGCVSDRAIQPLGTG